MIHTRNICRRLLVRALLSMIVLTISCDSSSSRESDPVFLERNGWIFEGWACAPVASMRWKNLGPQDSCDTSDMKQLTHLYLKFWDRPREDPAMSLLQRKVSCTNNARESMKSNPIQILNEMYGYMHSSLVFARPTDDYTDYSYLRPSIRSSGLYGCCSLDQDTGLCQTKPKADWRECTCVGFLEIEGGLRGFHRLLEKSTR